MSQTQSQIGGYIKAVTVPMICLVDVQTDRELKNVRIISNIMTILFVILAGYLCWQCNIKEDIILRVIYTLFACLFHVFYLVYYFIYRIVMKNAC